MENHFDSATINFLKASAIAVMITAVFSAPAQLALESITKFLLF